MDDSEGGARSRGAVFNTEPPLNMDDRVRGCKSHVKRHTSHMCMCMCPMSTVTRYTLHVTRHTPQVVVGLDDLRSSKFEGVNRAIAAM